MEISEEMTSTDYLRARIFEFREKWLLNNHELSILWDVPVPTLTGIINPNKKNYVKEFTAVKILNGIANYDPRTCIYRRIPKAGAAKIFNQIKVKHGLTWSEVSEITGAPEVMIWGVVTPTSQTKQVPIADMRRYIRNYHEWHVQRSEILIREGVA